MLDKIVHQNPRLNTPNPFRCKMASVYKHNRTGKLYAVIKIKYLNDLTIKQSSKNNWENPIFYLDTKTMQPFCTGEKRFKINFSKTNVKYKMEKE